MNIRGPGRKLMWIYTDRLMPTSSLKGDEYVICVDGRFGSAADKVVERLDSRNKKKIGV